MNTDAVLHHYTLTTGHVAKTPRSDVSPKILTSSCAKTRPSRHQCKNCGS